ncbi:hypothetical protein ACP275_09G124800 [Erythranthe tilingii]
MGSKKLCVNRTLNRKNETMASQWDLVKEDVSEYFTFRYIVSGMEDPKNWLPEEQGFEIGDEDRFRKYINGLKSKIAGYEHMKSLADDCLKKIKDGLNKLPEINNAILEPTDLTMIEMLQKISLEEGFAAKHVKFTMVDNKELVTFESLEEIAALMGIDSLDGRTLYKVRNGVIKKTKPLKKRKKQRVNVHGATAVDDCAAAST